jgi:anti-sigma B factor antagonist
MSARNHTGQEDARFRLSIVGELTIYRAAELKQTLLETLDQHRAIELDLSQVSEFDCAGLQLLLFAKRTALARRASLSLVEHSPPVREVFALLQLGLELCPSDPAEAAA